MKKIIPLFLIFALFLCTSCSSQSSSSQENEGNILTEEEQFAVDYLGAMSTTFKNPHSIKVYKAWFYEDSRGERYVAYDLSASNDVGGDIENFYGNKDGLKVDYSIGGTQESATSWEEAIKNYGTWVAAFGGDQYWKKNSYQNDFPAISDGKSLDAKKIQQAFEEQY